MIFNATEARNPDGTITVSSKCLMTGKPYSVTVSQKGYDAWKAGAYIQEVMHDVSVDDREFLISGLSPLGFEQACGPEKDE